MVTDPYHYFRLEARELVEHLVQSALDIEKGNRDALAMLLRHAHTLKGAARVVKQAGIADAAHAVEDVLQPFRDGSDAVPAAALESVLALVDSIRAALDALPGPDGAPEAPRAAPAASSAPAPVSVRSIRTDIGELDVVIDGLGETHARLGALQRDLGAVERVSDLADDIVAQLATAFASESTGSVGARTTEWARRTAVDLRRAVDDLARGADSGVARVDRELREMRDAVERMRLVPARALFTDLERAARDVARELGKRVEFAGEGGDVRLDAHVLETAQRALHQAVRNAVAHGIELEGDRLGAGKPASGTVTVSVEVRDARVVFACRDDGRGVDLEAVRARARAKGLPVAEADRLGRDDLVRLLLAGGISTSSAVTEVSGRGIGLDVVREAAVRLGGDVRVTTDPGRGTTIELDAPLSVAAFDVIEVDAAGRHVLLPLDAVAQTRRIDPRGIHVGTDGDVVTIDGAVVPFVPLASLLGEDTVELATDAPCTIVVLATAEGTAAIGVDRLLGTAGIVARPLPDLVRESVLVAGTAFDAEGNPRLVLAPDALVAEAPNGARRTRAADARPVDPILVVDDSLTTRMLEQSILESAGYVVEVATSAEEGLDVARRVPCSLFLVDVEMPGMDGFTFVEQTRADAVLRATPAILVSSRNAPEDLERGLGAGASAYITKGEFDQEMLLERVRELTVR
jgi:two-component system chemotaxis sensor kinase CheA